jgi:hypothetical protein
MMSHEKQTRDVSTGSAMVYKNKNSILKEDFCDKFDIEIHKLNYWIKKYNKERHPKKSPTKGEFIPLTPKESLTRETGINRR